MNSRRTSTEIERDIRATRASIDATIDALRSKMQPRALFDRGLELLKRDGSEIGTNIGRQIKQNPLPLALMSVSLAWLLVSDRRLGGDGDTDTHAHGAEHHREAIRAFERAEGALATLNRRTGEASDAFADRLSETKAKALELGREAGETIDAFRERVEHSWKSLAEQAAEARERLSSGARKAADQAKGKAEQVAHAAADAITDGARNTGAAVDRFYQAQPLVVGALAIGLGALAGALLPVTRSEREQLAEIGTKTRAAATKAVQAAEEDIEAAAEQAAGIAERVIDRGGAAVREGIRRVSGDAEDRLRPEADRPKSTAEA